MCAYAVHRARERTPLDSQDKTEKILSKLLQEPSPYHTKNDSVNEILSNNRGRLGVPSPSELLVLGDFERLCSREIEELEAKNIRLTQAVTDLFWDLLENGNEMKIKRVQLEILRSFRAPIHTLPPEVLSRIFQFTLPRNRKTLWKHSPQLLFRVCKAWKLVAESDPTLWNVFTHRAIYPQPSLKRFQNLCKCWKAYSVQAAAIPLTIEIEEYSRGVSTFDLDSVTELSSYFPRCTSLYLTIERYFFFNHVASLDSFPLSNMESLSILFNNKLDFDIDKTLPRGFDAITNASKLTKLKLNATPLQSKLIPIPFHQLTEFTYSAQVSPMFSEGDFSVEALRWLMKKLVNLHTLDVYLHGVGHRSFDIPEAALLSASQESSDVTSFDFLKNLTLRVGFRTSFNYVFRHFHFPALCSMRMVATGRPAALLIPTPINFSEEPTGLQFLSQLTSLALIRVEIDPDDLLALLRFTPLLSSLDVMTGEFLSIDNFVVSDQVLLEGLTINDPQAATESPIVPHLQDLRLYYDHKSEDAAPLYAKLALSRSNWANNRTGARELSEERRDAGLAYYPFRLYLKFPRSWWRLQERVAAQIGPLHSKIYRPEKSSSFLKET
ncbi:hypothetical protein M413DRAFT_448839 [Hebeloma cylindrosporum]|uniref:Uncharacterized protein n=1 Tax=Hebeloma cylindrosporum TaxID=76867 RepID=A0A0C3BJL1_HEBCY|nr:hypothetical protein M413DRAFT_448839 [Hebeloma cylindrosporum h7]